MCPRRHCTSLYSNWERLEAAEFLYHPWPIFLTRKLLDGVSSFLNLGFSHTCVPFMEFFLQYMEFFFFLFPLSLKMLSMQKNYNKLKLNFICCSITEEIPTSASVCMLTILQQAYSFFSSIHSLLILDNLGCGIEVLTSTIVVGVKVWCCNFNFLVDFICYPSTPMSWPSFKWSLMHVTNIN